MCRIDVDQDRAALAAASCVIAHSRRCSTKDADTVATLHPERDQSLRRAIHPRAEKFRVAVAEVLIEEVTTSRAEAGTRPYPPDRASRPAVDGGDAMGVGRASRGAGA